MIVGTLTYLLYRGGGRGFPAVPCPAMETKRLVKRDTANVIDGSFAGAIQFAEPTQLQQLPPISFKEIWVQPPRSGLTRGRGGYVVVLRG